MINFPISETINIVVGEVGASMLRLALGNESRILAHTDCLASGKVTDVENWPVWLADRKAHWEGLTKIARSDFFSNSNDLYANINELVDAGYILVWCGIGLEDQLLKTFIVRLLEFLNVELSKLHIVEYTTISGTEQNVLTLGYISADELLAHPGPRPVIPEAIEDLRFAWAAFTDKTPTRLVEYLRIEDNHSRLTQSAMRNLVRRFPDLGTGLDYWERQILIACSHNTKTAKILGNVLSGLGEGTDFTHETILLATMNSMIDNHNGTSLLVTDSSPTLDRHSNVELSLAGRHSMSGHLRIEPSTNIKKWIGGTHVNPQKPIWFSENNYTKIVSN